MIILFDAFAECKADVEDKSSKDAVVVHSMQMGKSLKQLC